jgi:hypothetical protein
MATEVGELGVRLETDFAPEGLNTGVDMGVLFEAGARGEGLAAVGTGVRSGAYMLGPDVPL